MTKNRPYAVIKDADGRSIVFMNDIRFKGKEESIGKK